MSTGLPTCALSETGALPTGVAFTDNGNGTATLTGTPAADKGGTYTLTITATNGVSPAATQAFTLTVYQACQITSHDHATFAVGQARTFTVATTGLPNCGLLESGTLPLGVTFTDNRNGTAAISGTPTTGGVYPLQIIAGNGIGGNATQTLTLIVRQSPQITSPADTIFTTGQAGTFTVATTGVPNSRLSETGALPSGVTFKDNKDGTATLAGTPAADTGGTYTLTITARNGVSPAATQAFTLTVYQACQITSPDHATLTVGRAGTFTVTTTGVPNCGLSESGKLPPGVTFADNGNGTATLAGTPAPGTGGTYLLTITAGNGIGGNAAQTLTLTVLQAPGITEPRRHHLYRRPGRDLYRHLDRGAQRHLVRGGRTADGESRSPATGTARRHLREHRLLVPAARTRSGSPPRTVSVLPPPSRFTLTVNQAPGITSADHSTCVVHKACAFTVKSTGAPTSTLSETGALPAGSEVQGQPARYGDTFGSTGCDTGGTYPITITATNGVSPDAIQSFTLIVVGPPAAPSGLKAASSGWSVSLTWNNNASAPSAATAIQIQRSTDAGFTTAVTRTTVGPAVTTHIDKAVVKGKKYYYRVRTHNSARATPAWSNVSSVTAPGMSGMPRPSGD